MTEAFSFRSALEVLWRRRIELAVLLIIAMGLTVFSASRVKPKYSATSTVLLVAEPPDNSDRQHPTTVQKPLLTGDLPALVMSETVLQRFRDRTHSKLGDGALRSQIRARVGGDSNLLPIEFSDSSSDVAIASANALASETTRYYREIATTRFDSLIADFKSELRMRSEALQGLDHKLQSLAGAYPYVDSKDGATSVYDRLVRLRSERDELSATVDADRANAQATSKRIAQARPLALSAVTNEDTAYARLKEQYSHDLTNYLHTASYGSASYPGLLELQATVSTEARDVANARKLAAAAGPETNATYVQALADVNKSQAAYAADQAKLGTVRAELASLEGQLGDGGSATVVSQIRREREAGDAAYALLAARLDQAIANRAEAASTGSLITIDRARVAGRQPWTTASLLVVALGIFSIWLAFSIVFLIESLDVRFRKTSTIERIFGAPVIGNLA